MGLPWVGFSDGEVEGNDLNNLWLLVCGSPNEKPLWGQPLWDGPPGSEKIAPVREAAIETFARLPEEHIPDLAAAWRQAESKTSSLQSWRLEDVAEAIRELKFLARQHQKLRFGWQLLVIWWV